MSASPEPAGPTPRAALRAWLWWIAVSAAGAVMIGLLHVLTQRRFGHHFEGQLTVLLFAVIFLAAMPAVLQGLVLRRLAVGLSCLAWVVTSWLTSVIATIVWSTLRTPTLNADRAFDTARILAASTGGRVLWPWLALALYAGAIALLYDLVPILVFGWLARRRSRAFLLATVASACAAVLLHKLYSGFTYLEVRSLYEPFDMTRAQASWPALAQPLATLALFGMIRGAISGFGLVRMFAPAVEAPAEAGRFGARMAPRVFGVVALVVVGMHLARYAVGPNGYPAGFPDLRRLVSSAPASDRSSGAPILSFSRRIALPGPVRYVAPSPDGRTVLLLTSTRSIQDQAVIRLDAQTGASAPTPLIANGSARSIVFSPDGRYLAISQEGRRRGERDHYFGRIRLFATDGFTELADDWTAEQDCAFSLHMAFSQDGGGLWVLCETSRDRPQDLFAVKLAVPSLDVLERRCAPSTGEPREYGSASAIVAGASGVFVGGYRLRDVGGYLSVTNVTTTVRPLLASLDIAQAVPGSPGFGFCGLHLSQDAALVTLAHCMPPLRFEGDIAAQKGQFRTFRTDSGELIADFGRQVPGQDRVTWTVVFDRVHGRFAGIGTTATSKTGVLVVWDQATGRELQRIETAAYRTGAFSADGRWLLLVARDEEALSLYHAAP